MWEYFDKKPDSKYTYAMILCLRQTMQKKLIITAGTIIWALYVLGSVFSLTLNFPDISSSSFADRLSLVHFIAPGNNFVGSIFRLPTKSVSPIKINIGSDSKTCTKQVRGLYFNSQRGKRLRPLDEDSLQLLRDQNPTYNTLSISGGLYTTCDSGNNYGIFGKIDYDRWGIVTNTIVAGTKLEYAPNKMLVDIANSLQYFDNKVPIGYIYDSYGGIGYVGGLVTGHTNLIAYLNKGGSIQSGFIYSGDTIISSHATDRETTIYSSGNAAMQTMRNLIIQGSVGLSKSIEEKERISFLGNVNEKTIIYNGSDINSSTVINFAKQKAQSLCQGKQFNQALNTNTNILCYENIDVTIDLTQPTNYEDKTIIVKNGNILLEGGMGNDYPPLDILIDKWLLYLPDPIIATGFDDQGFPSSPGINSWLYLKGNFIINGLLVAGNPGAEASFWHKLHLQGKITMLNTPTLPTQERKDQVEEILWTNTYKPWINLQNVFTWTCGLSGTGSDGSLCANDNIISTIPLVILNGNYPSNLLQ